jgi:hypothetical protein
MKLGGLTQLAMMSGMLGSSGLRRTQTRYVGADFQVDVQLFEAKEWLLSEGYKAEYLTAARELDALPSPGLVFAAEHRLRTLRERGWLTLMDSTHDSNWLKWYLYTVMVQDEGGWMPAAHFITEKEDGHIVVSCLTKLKKWCGGARG